MVVEHCVQSSITFFAVNS